MRNIVRKAILKASLTDFELACIAGVMVIVSDMSWLAHDIAVNGFSLSYGFIGFGMLVGLVSTLFVIVRHNRTESAQLVKEELKAKRKMCKRIAKHKREHNER